MEIRFACDVAVRRHSLRVPLRLPASPSVASHDERSKGSRSCSLRSAIDCRIIALLTEAGMQASAAGMPAPPLLLSPWMQGILCSSIRMPREDERLSRNKTHASSRDFAVFHVLEAELR